MHLYLDGTVKYRLPHFSRQRQDTPTPRGSSISRVFDTTQYVILLASYCIRYPVTVLNPLRFGVEPGTPNTVAEKHQKNHKNCTEAGMSTNQGTNYSSPYQVLQEVSTGLSVRKE